MKNRFLRKAEVLSLVGLSLSSVNRLEKQGLFPKRRVISQRAVAWLEAEVLAWISEVNQRVEFVAKERARESDGMLKCTQRTEEHGYE